ncbi:uncharacterized protein A1O9_11816 [Exophiala aquamarina CBS 119918]|uniref:Major facilitator superfamily (MFS) profile domain-containing protein n=1 Tax=Exophiala aquamarina CBS 119918 TaxID=1182545 RepID=A0A072NWD4_9EURO|nr:uncharacterized protein A1O9_11816 [Exophiala aquamarina CBS 119918]KEF52189.1 hypothetical protein A1O9_11816 [Exophiala aquamarina CBS 119918]
MVTKGGVAEAYPREKLGVSKSSRRQTWWKLGGRDVSHISVNDGYVDSDAYSFDEGGNDAVVKNANNVFDAPEASLYKPVEGFEGTHRFDPSATWTQAEEKALMKKLDWRIALPACIMFFALQLDRGNIVQALSDNMLSERSNTPSLSDRSNVFTKDLGLTTDHYNNGQTFFFYSFLFAELPSQLISKKLGPDTWIPIQMVSWSIVAASQAALSGETSFYVCRALLGLIEGGFIPDTILYLSYFYKNSELPRRLSWFWTSYQSTQVVGAFLAYGILHLRGHSGLHEGWRRLHWPHRHSDLAVPTSFPNPNGTTRNQGPPPAEKRLVQRARGDHHRDSNSAGRPRQGGHAQPTGHQRAAVLGGHHRLRPVASLPDRPVVDHPIHPAASLHHTGLKALGFDSFETNLLTIPAYVLFILQLLFWTWVSERINQRILLGVIGQIWCLPLLVALVALLSVFHNSNWSKWVLSTLLVGYPYVHAILVALTSRNSGTVRTRTVGPSLYNMAVQTSNIVSSQIYRADDKPYYYHGNKVLLGIVAWNIVVFVFAKAYYVRKNNQRDRIRDSMSREERVHYLATTTDQGNKRLDFRFAS